MWFIFLRFVRLFANSWRNFEVENYWSLCYLLKLRQLCVLLECYHYILNHQTLFEWRCLSKSMHISLKLLSLYRFRIFLQIFNYLLYLINSKSIAFPISLSARYQKIQFASQSTLQSDLYTLRNFATSYATEYLYVLYWFRCKANNLIREIIYLPGNSFFNVFNRKHYFYLLYKVKNNFAYFRYFDSSSYLYFKVNEIVNGH